MHWVCWVQAIEPEVLVDRHTATGIERIRSRSTTFRRLAMSNFLEGGLLLVGFTVLGGILILCSLRKTRWIV